MPGYKNVQTNATDDTFEIVGDAGHLPDKLQAMEDSLEYFLTSTTSQNGPSPSHAVFSILWLLITGRISIHSQAV